MEAVNRIIKKNEFISAALCAALVLLLTVAGGVFWSRGNLDSLQANIAPTAIMAFGMMFLLILGYFDLSISSTMLLAGILSAKFTMMGLPIPAIVLLVLLAGVAMGLLNGFLVSVVGINALIATISTQYMGYGLAMTLWDGVRGMGRFSDSFVALGSGKFLGLYWMTWVMLLLLAGFWYFLHSTPTGRSLYFVGGNREAAKLMGFNNRRVVLLAYTVTGLLAALAGVLAVARIESPTQYLGENIHMTCMIACVVGGGSFAGGKGSALGAVLGVTFMSLMTNMFTLLKLKPQFQNIIVGLILIAVIVLDGWSNLKKMREQGKI
ncbi:ABC transporter permease [Colidextribacter sp. OB.20]|uniref:ABC transporter permease n=1 Tax=Colidextribacter sp. OB.20 TaxID=2304568 RepID=UPI001368F052|nr:ABC transporter permease [Colidextribacter sp. OB.20]